MPPFVTFNMLTFQRDNKYLPLSLTGHIIQFCIYNYFVVVLRSNSTKRRSSKHFRKQTFTLLRIILLFGLCNPLWISLCLEFPDLAQKCTVWHIISENTNLSLYYVDKDELLWLDIYSIPIQFFTDLKKTGPNIIWKYTKQNHHNNAGLPKQSYTVREFLEASPFLTYSSTQMYNNKNSLKTNTRIME